MTAVQEGRLLLDVTWSLGPNTGPVCQHLHREEQLKLFRGGVGRSIGHQVNSHINLHVDLPLNHLKTFEGQSGSLWVSAE
uniref:Uncharacterized protein n=1 Tax=Anguilla anguilla TaxID=7936 RepID=A0A0E9RNG6_ANGAN